MRNSGLDRRPSPVGSEPSLVGAVVIGGDYRGLGVVRSLGRRGIPVWVVRTPGDHWLTTVSRYTLRTVTLPVGPEAGQLAFLTDLARHCGLSGWLLMAMGDETAAFLARHHAALSEQFRVTTAPWETFRWAYDKRLTYQLARDIGLPVPATVRPRDRTDVEAYDGPFPAAVKPAIKPGRDRLSVDKAWRADDREELLARYSEACRLLDPASLLIQEVIPGDGAAQMSFAALCQDGEPLASVVARRVRQHPMDFGRSSTYVVTADDDEVVKLARQLLDRLPLTGLVEIEFKRDPRTGEYLLLDVNARVWGWHTIGRRIGLDFPYLLWRLTLGEEVTRHHGAAGWTWLRLSTDLAASLPELLHGRMRLRNYLSSVRHADEDAIHAPDDPLPGWLELPMVAAFGVMNRLRQRRRRSDTPVRSERHA